MNQDERLSELTTACVRTEVIVEDLAKIVADHETRLRWVERGLSYGSGIAFAVYFIANKFIGS